MFMPHAIAFNLPVCQDKLARAALLIGEKPHNKTEAELARRFLARIIQLLTELNFPKRFDPIDLEEPAVKELVLEMKRSTPDFLDSNLRKVTEDDIIRICRDATRGWDHLMQ
jgi:alcohol dehydrogenase class IV